MIMESGIMSTWKRSNAEQRQAGALWYPRAYGVALVLASAGGVSVQAATAVLAHLSPRCHWMITIRGAWSLMTMGDAPGHIGAHVERARAALDSDDPLGTINGPKTRSFAANILGDLDAVTVDVWALRVACGSSADANTIRRQSGYDNIVDQYREVAAKIKVPPAVLQATTWIVARNGRQS